MCVFLLQLVMDVCSMPLSVHLIPQTVSGNAVHLHITTTMSTCSHKPCHYLLLCGTVRAPLFESKYWFVCIRTFNLFHECSTTKASVPSFDVIKESFRVCVLLWAHSFQYTWQIHGGTCIVVCCCILFYFLRDIRRSLTTLCNIQYSQFLISGFYFLHKKREWKCWILKWSENRLWLEFLFNYIFLPFLV